MTEEVFKKRFSIGLALDAEVREYVDLFKEYAPYIDNLYFSPPLGDQFHGRSKVAQQFHSSELRQRFWEILKVAKEFDIDLEVVFNTHLLTKDDLLLAKETFDRCRIQIDKICTQDAYYETIKELYPEKPIVHSVNCMPDDRNQILASAPEYSEYVVGRQYIRDANLFREIQERGSRCVLLLNNGCSFFCGGCAKIEHCKDTFDATVHKKGMSIQEVYGLSSIMPFELHEGLVDISNVFLLKLSTRNADGSYMRACLDSYIFNKNRDYIEMDYRYYLLWSRLAWPVPYFSSFNYAQIEAYKRNLNKPKGGGQCP